MRCAFGQIRARLAKHARDLPNVAHLVKCHAFDQLVKCAAQLVKCALHLHHLSRHSRMMSPSNLPAPLSDLRAGFKVNFGLCLYMLRRLV